MLLMQVYNTPFGSWMETETLHGSPPSTFLTLIVGALGYLAPPPRGPTDVSCVDGGCPRISIIASQGPHHRCLLHLWWTLPDLRHHLLGGRRRRFFVLMVGAPGSPTPPPKGSVINIFCVDGGHSQISGTASYGARHQYFLALMLGAPGSPTPLPRGSAVDIS
jgi:hypothetical protein